MRKKTAKFTAIIGAVATAIGILGFFLCCNVLLATLLGTGIVIILVENNQLLLGIGTGLIIASFLMLMFEKRTCSVKLVEKG
ncbi:MAG TPA: hypothetical protein EYP86_04305 [Candidatus Altiarchaeales archaeon]|nr:hypothetical protein [Candidatus Altiarchaeales archaeon]